MNCNTSPVVDKLLSDALRTLDELDPEKPFTVQDLIPPAIWRELPVTPTRGNLGSRFFEEMKNRPNVRMVGKTESGQTVYIKTE